MAVDEDGCIARFWCGSRGEAPHRARGRGRGVELDDAIDVAAILRSLVLPQTERQRPDALMADRLLLVLDESRSEPGYRDTANMEHAIERELAAFSPRVLRNRAPRVILTRREVDMQTILGLAKRLDVRHLLGMSDVVRRVATMRARFYRYEHDPAMRGPRTEYGRLGGTLSKPLLATEIPEPERSALVALRVPVRFATADLIDIEGLVADVPPEKAASATPDPLRRPSRHALPSWVVVMGPLLLWLVVRLLLTQLR